VEIDDAFVRYLVVEGPEVDALVNILLANLDVPDIFGLQEPEIVSYRVSVTREEGVTILEGGETIAANEKQERLLALDHLGALGPPAFT